MGCVGLEKKKGGGRGSGGGGIPVPPIMRTRMLEVEKECEGN